MTVPNLLLPPSDKWVTEIWSVKKHLKTFIYDYRPVSQTLQEDSVSVHGQVA